MRNRRLSTTAFLCQSLLTIAVTVVLADDKRMEKVQPAAAADFSLQGEYSGVLSQGMNSPAPFGLQLIAQGDGQFEAVLYAGGLPGAGATGEKQKLAGKLANHKLVLNGPRLRVEIENGAATVQDEAGNRGGHLAKVERHSRTLGLAPPPNSLLLFDGGSTAAFHDGKLASDGSLLAGAITGFPVGDFRLHLEFRTPFMPQAKGQARGNSGVYIQQRYELQILDSFGLEGAENECGGLYKQRRPELNMCLPPLTWQTYDIWFTAARFDACGNKLCCARITVWHNGVPIHRDYEITAKTGAGKAEGPDTLPILLQDHGNPVTFRNIWMTTATTIRTTTQNYSHAQPIRVEEPSHCCRRALFARRR